MLVLIYLPFHPPQRRSNWYKTASFTFLHYQQSSLMLIWTACSTVQLARQPEQAPYEREETVHVSREKDHLRWAQPYIFLAWMASYIHRLGDWNSKPMQEHFVGLFRSRYQRGSYGLSMFFYICFCSSTTLFPTISSVFDSLVRIPASVGSNLDDWASLILVADFDTEGGAS